MHIVLARLSQSQGRYFSIIIYCTIKSIYYSVTPRMCNLNGTGKFWILHASSCQRQDVILKGQGGKSDAEGHKVRG